MWKDNSPALGEKGSYTYDKYGRGLRYFLAGIILSSYGLLELAGSIDTAGIIVELLK
ncbi:MAG: hypothetical protein GY807_11040 [Gammaproteobacteria bacterium]|nr:hypothetical protein [Gammaproteobacteria bacterium]